MVIKLKQSKDNMAVYNEKRAAYANMVKNGASVEEQETVWSEMQDALVEGLRNEISSKFDHPMYNDDEFTKSTLNATERKFFNSITTDVGTKNEILLPETTIDRIFEELTTDHPLLQVLNLRTTGIKTRIIQSDKTGTAVWGKVFGEIKGQLDVLFTDENVMQGKLTAFVVVPKDITEYGPQWVEAFVRAQIVETFSLALEQGFLRGAGPVKDEPIGLIKDLSAGESPTSGYTDKTSSGTLTFSNSTTIVNELSNVIKHLAVKENGKSMKVKGKVYIVANPVDAIEIEKRCTVLTSDGVYVQAIPFGVKIIESEFMNTGELLCFVQDRYDAFIGGGVNIKKFDQTLALEDCNLYTSKQFAFGKARDNKSAVLFTLSTD